MIVAFTGHRSGPKLGGYEVPNPTYEQVCQETEALLKELKPTECISGMAIGFDQWAAMVCVKLGIPFLASIPFIGQEKRWPKQSQDQYRFLLSKAAKQVVVCDKFSIAAFQRRNEHMVDNCDQLIACFDGTKGGTANCVAYAEKMKKPIHRIIPLIEQPTKGTIDQ
jgi:uncharacterized phage-like protein YoqJ